MLRKKKEVKPPNYEQLIAQAQANLNKAQRLNDEMLRQSMVFASQTKVRIHR